MTTTAGRPYSVHVLRLLPGEDVRRELKGWCQDRQVEAAAIVSAVGSVSKAVLRLGGRSDGHTTEGDLEVCMLSGTLSRYGLHLHMAVADANGAMTGGHLLEGTLVRTTLEVAVQEIGGMRMLRRMDERTGFNELIVETITP